MKKISIIVRKNGIELNIGSKRYYQGFGNDARGKVLYCDVDTSTSNPEVFYKKGNVNMVKCFESIKPKQNMGHKVASIKIAKGIVSAKRKMKKVKFSVEDFGTRLDKVRVNYQKGIAFLDSCGNIICTL